MTYEKRYNTDNNTVAQIFIYELFNLTKVISNNKRTFFLITFFFITLGVSYSLITPNLYKSTIIVVPQSNDKKVSGNLSGLAAMAGINIGSMSYGEVLSPNVYSKIISNINFQKELIYSKYNYLNIDYPISFYEYCTNNNYKSNRVLKTITNYNIGIPMLLIGRVNNVTRGVSFYTNDTLINTINAKETIAIRKSQEAISINIDEKAGYVTIQTIYHDAMVSAQLTQKTLELLQKYLTEFKVDKVVNNLQFITINFEEAKREFELKQAELANYRDANSNISTSLGKTIEEKLVSECNLLEGVYTELAKQKMQAKIAIRETTPVLTIIQPVVVPLNKSYPNRSMIIVCFTILGLLLAYLYIRHKETIYAYLFELKTYINNKNG